MRLKNLIVAWMLLAAGLSDGREGSPEWFRDRDQSWERTRVDFPQSTVEGPFLTRMLEIDAWAKQSNPSLYANPNKPYLLAQYVQAERDEGARKEREWRDKRAREEIQTSYSDLQSKKDAEHNRIVTDWQNNHKRYWIMFLCHPLLAMAGYFWDKDGIRRRGLWVYLAIATGLVVLMMADRDIYGRYQNSHDVELEGHTRIIGGLIFSYAIGKRARNAGYRWWLAGLSGVPLIALPMVLHLLIFKGKRKTPEELLSQQDPLMETQKNETQVSGSSRVESVMPIAELHDVNEKPESQQALRARFAMVTSTLWTGEDAYHEPIQEEIKRVMRPDSTLNWIIEKLGYLPKFPTEDKGAMEREVMEILTAFRVDLDPEELPTMEEAMEDPQEVLLSLMETVISIIDLRAGERD